MTNLIQYSLFILLCLSACKSDKKTEVQAVTPEVETPTTKYQLTPFATSTAFKDASILSMAYQNGNFDFDVNNYLLGDQTPDAISKMCANSKKGQHIHLIVNDAPYAAKYTHSFEHGVDDGEQHILAFLSRSYHESIKTKDAHKAQKVMVKNGSITEATDITEPMLFYSRPKGTYVGSNDTHKVMLDFYLVNTDISEDGNYVEANINGEIHKITKWQPYYITGLPMGDNYVSLILKDKNGDKIEAPYNPVKRIFTLKEDQLEK